MITVYDNKLLPGHLALLESGDVCVGYPSHISRLDLTIDDFNLIPTNSLVLIFDAAKRHYDEDVWLTALITLGNQVYCCSLRKGLFTRLTTEKRL